MADENITRIYDKLEDLQVGMATLKEAVSTLTGRIDKYNNVTGRTSDLETQILLIKQNCQTVQDAKKIQRIPWGNVKASIITGVIVGVIMIAINIALAYSK